jgi:nitroreductase
MCAPSAYNNQPWEFIVITDKTVLKKISAFDSYASMAQDAPLAILICGNLDYEDQEAFLVQDCSAAAENILLAATALNLGSVWTTIYPFDEVVAGFRKLFSLPENIIPLILIPVGYSEQKNEQINRYKEDKVHYDKW